MDRMPTEVRERPAAVPAAVIGLAPLAARMPAVVRLLAAAHATAFLQTNGRLLGRWFGTRILILETVGRHSGQVRRTPLVYLRDDTNLVVVAGNGGAPRHPNWWLNLHSAGHAVAVLGRDRIDVRPREAGGHERERLWRRFAEVTAVDAYQRHTVRRLPIVVLTPTADRPICHDVHRFHDDTARVGELEARVASITAHQPKV